MSERFTIDDALEWTGGRLLAGDPRTALEGVSIDTRSVGAGELFVAIRGPNHDAHRFLDAAVAAGAAALLVQEDAQGGLALPEGPDVVAVADTTRALGELAAGHRARFSGPVVAITGSNGKTTTKEMCAAILVQRGPCLRTRGNLNNEFGLPLTLLDRAAADRYAVVEMGMNHRGEIARLAAIARPTVGVLINVGTAHIEYLGSQEEIAREKGDLLAALDADGTAVVNRDDPLASAQAERCPGSVLGFGLCAEADVRASDVTFDAGAYRMHLVTPGGECELRVPGLAETTVPNALAACAGALAAGASLGDVVAGLGAFENVGGRMEFRALPGRISLIDDSYNANPQSMRAALESLVRLKDEARGVAVLGDMGELGEESENAHRDLGRWAAELGVDFLYPVGDHAERVGRAAREAGMSAEAVVVSEEPDPERTGEELARSLRAGDWVLVKGSRAMRMEDVARALERALVREAAEEASP